MRDAAGNPYFVAEALQQSFVAGSLFRQKLQGDGLA